MNFNLNISNNSSNTQFNLNKLTNGNYSSHVNAFASRFMGLNGVPNNTCNNIVANNLINSSGNTSSNTNINSFVSNLKANTISPQSVNQQIKNNFQQSNNNPQVSLGLSNNSFCSLNRNFGINSVNNTNNLNYQLNTNAGLGMNFQANQNLTTNASPSLLASVIAANNAVTYSQTACNLNNTLFVGNLHASLQEIDLIQVFKPFGRIVECCKKWLHFGFVKFTTEEEACHAYITLNGFRLKGRPMRLEFQNRTKKARIKAILAQAALQAAASSCSASNNDVSEALTTLGISSFLTDDRQQINLSNVASTSYYNQASFPYSSSSSSSMSSASSTCSLNNNASKKTELNLNGCSYADQLMKFATTSEKDKESKDLDFNFDFFSDLTSKETLAATSKLYTGSQKHNLGEVFYNELKENNLNPASMSSSIKFNLNDELLSGNYTKKMTSPGSSSPQHDISSSLSLSSDSGCRSTSFLADEQDSAICSIQTKSCSLYAKSELINSEFKSTDCTISEHLEFTCSKSSPSGLSNKMENVDLFMEKENNSNEKNNLSINEDDNNDEDDVQDDESDADSDTSDDASEIPNDSDCLNDLDLMDDIFSTNSTNNNSESNCDFAEQNKYHQVLEKDGTIVRKKLDYGIYRSINKTFSLFIEPQDILQKMNNGEFEEYILFPNGVDMLDSYLIFKQALVV